MKLLITKKASKELDKIPNKIAKNIAAKILELSSNPYPIINSKKLQSKNSYRIRIGSFRVIYFINKVKKEITILRIADRKTVYQ